MNQARAESVVDRIRIQSRFADTEVDPRDIVSFPDGLPGYEGRREFVLLDSEEIAPLKVLHGIGADQPCFLVVDPTSVLSNYRCELASADRLRLGAGTDESGLLWLSIVTVREDGTVTANLRAPIVINTDRMVGRQVMPNNGLYPLHQTMALGEGD